MDAMDKNGDTLQDGDSDPRSSLKDEHAPPSGEANKTPKKRRKVNHGMATPSHFLLAMRPG